MEVFTGLKIGLKKQMLCSNTQLDMHYTGLTLDEM